MRVHIIILIRNLHLMKYLIIAHNNFLWRFIIYLLQYIMENTYFYNTYRMMNYIAYYIELLDTYIITTLFLLFFFPFFDFLGHTQLLVLRDYGFILWDHCKTLIGTGNWIYVGLIPYTLCYISNLNSSLFNLRKEARGIKQLYLFSEA